MVVACQIKTNSEEINRTIYCHKLFCIYSKQAFAANNERCCICCRVKMNIYFYKMLIAFYIGIAMRIWLNLANVMFFFNQSLISFYLFVF